MQISDSGGFNWGIVMGAAQINYAFLAGVSIDDHFLKTRRYDFILFCEKKNGSRLDVSAIREAIQLSRDLKC